MSTEFFSEVHGPIPFSGPASDDPLAFKVYRRGPAGPRQRMEDRLRAGVCYWHSFAWDGRDMFGLGTLDRPWLEDGVDPMAAPG